VQAEDKSDRIVRESVARGASPGAELEEAVKGEGSSEATPDQARNRATQQPEPPNLSGGPGLAEGKARGEAVDRSAIERRAEQLFGLELWGSDLLWDSMGLQGGLCWLLCPLRQPIQTLTHKYQSRPATFLRQLSQLLRRRVRQVNRDPAERESLAWFAEYHRRVHEAVAAVTPHSAERTKPKRPARSPSFSLPDSLSLRQLQAIDELLPLVGAPFTGRALTEADPRKLLDSMKAFTVRPAGRKRTKAEYYAKGLELLESSHHRKTIHDIVHELNPAYKNMSAVARRAERDRWRTGIARARQTREAESRPR
jgi:hypothetical protein